MRADDRNQEFLQPFGIFSASVGVCSSLSTQIGEPISTQIYSKTAHHLPASAQARRNERPATSGRLCFL